MGTHFKTVKYACLLILILPALETYAQNYQAIHGSSYAGSLGVGNNPACIVNTPFSWDVDIFSLQARNTTNAVTIYNYSLLSSPAKSRYANNPGNFARKGDLNYNINVLNARFALNRRQAIAFGCNIRGYARATTSAFNYNDTMQTVRQFFTANSRLTGASGDFAGSNWIELFATYGQTLWDRPADRLNAAITLKVSRGLAGGYARVRDGSIQQEQQGNKIVYLLKNATAQYGYSSNFDSWQNNKSSSQNIHDFLSRTQGGISVDLGLEYLIKDQSISTAYGEDDYYDYTWKIGVSLMDLGFNRFKYGNQSRRLTGVKPGTDATIVNDKLVGVQSLKEFNDSVATIVNSSNAMPGSFRVFNPARLIVNADRFITGAFYVNGELSLNLSSLAGDNHLYVRELNLITITPRWETMHWGVYMPIQYNVARQFMVGAAIKAGPLLIGLHNLGNIFSKNKMQNGGGYIALVLRSGKLLSAKGNRQYECPPAAY